MGLVVAVFDVDRSSLWPGPDALSGRNEALASGIAIVSVDVDMGDNRLRTRETAGALGEEQWHSIDVETVPLDEIVPSSERPLVLKIDTQGAEPHVVEGGRKTILRADLVVLEFWPYGMARMGADQNWLLEFFINNFDYMSIAPGETAAIPSPLPIGQACEVLSALTIDPNVYVDVITGRDVRRAVAMG